LNKKPLGTGPFRFLEWKTGAKTVFEANPDYFEDRPYLSRVITRVIPDPATMFLELKSGGIDMMGLTPIQYTRQTKTEEFRKSFNKYRYLSFGYTYLGFRLSHPLFTDRRVRQAFAYAIHKKEIIDGVLFGLGQEATGPYKPGTWAHNPDVKKYPYDPEKAKALLAEAGWKDGPDQRREREPRQDGGDHPAEPLRRRGQDGDPDAGVGGLHQRVRRQAQIRCGDPRLEHLPGSRPVRHLELEEDGAEGAQLRWICE
jgi:peptide/nickel transport system substrate-binding protein